MTKRYQQYLAVTALDNIVSQLTEARVLNTHLEEGRLLSCVTHKVSTTRINDDHDLVREFKVIAPDAEEATSYGSKRAISLERHGYKIVVWFLYADNKDVELLKPVPLDEEF